MLPTMSRVTIHDVARAAGVSVATVSKVINRRYGVASSTHARVEQVIEELGYESSLVARSLRSHQTHVIGILVAEFEPFSTEILKGASRAITGTGYELLAYSGGGRPGSDVGWERRYVSRLSGTLIDGALLVTPTVVDVSATVPLVMLDPHTGPTGLPTVDADSLAGAVSATEHLITLGHRRIGFLGGREDLESSQRREEGYRRALAGAGLPVDPDLIRVGGYRRESAEAPVAELLALPDPPTAIFAANDLMALGAMAVATRMGLRVPDDLSLVGFDDVPEAVIATPQLTTVRQPIQELGAVGIDLLVQLMAGRVPQANHVRLPTELVVRGTTRAR